MRTLSVALLPLFAACVEMEPEASVEYFEGTRVAYHPDGELSSQMNLLVKRTLDPVASTIDEEVVMITEGMQPMQMSNGCAITDGKISGIMADSYGNLSISGEMYGEPWMWNNWETVATYLDGALQGSTITTIGETCLEGMVNDQEIRDASGELVWTVSEQRMFIDAQTWEDQASALGL